MRVQAGILYIQVKYTSCGDYHRTFRDLLSARQRDFCKPAETNLSAVKSYRARIGKERKHMKQKFWRTAAWMAIGMLALTILTPPHTADAQQSKRRTKTTTARRRTTKRQTGSKTKRTSAVSKPGGTARAQVTALINSFEDAYRRKDKKMMLMQLMAPTQDSYAVEKRYQWYRGFGPTDMAGTKHPPILFETSRGSFVPKVYLLKSLTPVDAASRWNAVVEEHGVYKDEDGVFRVIRNRDMKLQKYKNQWYVMDYTLRENPEDLGFYVDTIYDAVIPDVPGTKPGSAKSADKTADKKVDKSDTPAVKPDDPPAKASDPPVK